MTDFHCNGRPEQQQQQHQQQHRGGPPMLRVPPPLPPVVVRPYFDFNDIFGSAGKKPSPSISAAANNNNNINNNNGSTTAAVTQAAVVATVLKQQQQQQQPPAVHSSSSSSTSSTSSCCPVCGIALRPQELESHFVYELERLYKASAAAGASRRHKRAAGSVASDKPGDKDHLVVAVRDGRLSPVTRDGSLHGRWETYQKVKANRHNRLRIKNRKRKPDEICCPVCSEPMSGTQEQMNIHVEMCLRNKGHPGNNEDENVDVEGDTEMYDAYGWPNRMRQQPMIVHGYNRGVPIVNCNPRQSTTADDEDAVLVVDDNGEDDLYKYGPNQYAEQDIISPPSSESQLTPEQNDLSAMETSTDFGENNSGPLDVSIKKENLQEDGTIMAKPKMDVEKYQFNNNQIVEALKARIRELELVSKTSDKFTCLLCKGNFKDPVVSTSCWHVYCEVCWLQILGAKKLCPQCYVITLPSHLRRVYL